MFAKRWRCLPGTYLVLFFVAVAAAPHHHINDLEDLLLDQRSDSGTIVQTIGPAADLGTLAFRRARVTSDIPCLACFTRDFVGCPVASFVFVPRLMTLPLLPELADGAAPELLPADTTSRSPPSLS